MRQTKQWCLWLLVLLVQFLIGKKMFSSDFASFICLCGSTVSCAGRIICPPGHICWIRSYYVRELLCCWVFKMEEKVAGWVRSTTQFSGGDTDGWITWNCKSTTNRFSTPWNWNGKFWESTGKLNWYFFSLFCFLFHDELAASGQWGFWLYINCIHVNIICQNFMFLKPPICKIASGSNPFAFYVNNIAWVQGHVFSFGLVCLLVFVFSLQYSHSCQLYTPAVKPNV